jgi:hypothetical protein
MWVLIYWVLGINSIATGQVTFSSQSACSLAKADLTHSDRNAQAVCVERD